MKPYRKTAIAVGLLFPAATVAFYAANVLVLGVLSAADASAQAVVETNALTTGALLFFVDALAVVAIAFLLYPLLKRDSERVALGYVGMRVVEFAAVLLVMSPALQLVPLSMVSTLTTPAGAIPVATFEHMLEFARPQYEAAMALVFLCTATSGIILAWALIRSKLVPRMVAALGAIGYAGMLLGTVLEMFGLLDMQQGAGLLLVAPVGLFENLVLPLWLFARGFDSAPGRPGIVSAP